MNLYKQVEKQLSKRECELKETGNKPEKYYVVDEYGCITNHTSLDDIIEKYELQIVPTSEHQKTMDKYIKWYLDIYNSISPLDGQMTLQKINNQNYLFYHGRIIYPGAQSFRGNNKETFDYLYAKIKDQLMFNLMNP